MVALQLLFFLVALLALDGAEPNRKQLSKGKKPCENQEWNMFCQYVKSAYSSNEEAIYELVDQEVDRESFTEDIQRLRDTNRAISKLLKLKAKNKSDLLAASRIPLGKEVHALFQLRVTCSDGRRPLIVCNETLDFVLLDLMKAIEEVTERSQLKEIKEARKNFQPEYIKPPEDKTTYEIVNFFGSAVLRILYTYIQ